MRIVFFGTSHGVPEPRRHCACTLIEIGQRRYFIDMGMPAIDELISRGMSPDSVKGIFITHMHGDHANGLISFVDLSNWYFKTVSPTIMLPEPQGVEAIRAWLGALGCDMREFDFRVTNEGVTYDDGTLKVTAYRTKHCRTSYAYLVEGDGAKVLFTGDLAGPAKDFPAEVLEMELDLLICEGAHFPVIDYAPLFKGCRAKKICVTHYAPWNVPNILKLTEEIAPLPVISATDGREFTLPEA